MKKLLPLTIFVAAYMLGFGILAIIRGNQEFIFYTATMVVMIAGILLIHKRVGFSMGLLWLLAVWGLLHLAGGLVPVNDAVLYNLWLIRIGDAGVRYDHAVHAYGFAVAAWASWQALAGAIRAMGGAPRPTPGIAFALICMSTGLGALNEVVEFAATKLVPDTNVGGYENTAWDLVSNLIGATIAATIILLGRPKVR